jgi:thiol:disulfide interchange protein DsbC
MISRVLPLALASALFVPAFAQDVAPAVMVEKIKSLYPKTRFRDIRPSQIPGIYEVVMGDNIAYTDESGRYFIFGHLYDMKEQVDITAQRKLDQRKTEFPAQLLGNAIKTVRGDGSRVIAVFSDPDCTYCKKLESELARLDNLTIYTFLYPLEQLHLEAKTKAVAVWCAPDRTKAWNDLMLRGQAPKLVACSNPVNDNLVLGSRLGVVGTPTLIAADGRVLPGSAPAEVIDRWLSTAQLAQARKETAQ